MTEKPTYEELEKCIEELTKAHAEQGQILKKIRESEERYRITAIETGQLIYSYNPETNNVIWSGALEAITGYSSEEFNSLGTSGWLDNLHPDDSDMLLKTLDQAIKNKDRYDVEYRLKRKDGKYIHVEEHGTYVSYDQDCSYLFVGTINNINKRKKTENELREGERRLKISTESGGVGLWELNLINHTSWRSLKHDQIFGYETLLPEWTYEMFFEHVIEDDRPMVERKFGNALENIELWDFKCRIKRTDGVERWIWAKGNPEVDINQKPIKMCGTVQDITDLKHVEDSLQKSEFIFKQTFEQSSTSTCFYDPEGTIIRVNQEYCKMFGVKELEILNARYNIFNDQAVIEAGVIPVIREIFENKKTRSLQVNFDIAKASDSTGTPTIKGEKIYLEIFGYPVVNHQNELEFVVLKHYDITDRKQAEESSNRLKERLESLWNITKIADSDIKTISDHVLEEVQKMTQSQYAFYGFLDKNENEMILHAWSHETMDDCKTNEKTIHFAIDKAGIWAEAVKEKNILTINDFNLDHPGKRGVPDGHVQLTRLMAVPYIKDDKVISIVAVANKGVEYSTEDEKQMLAFMRNVQLLIDRKTAEQEAAELVNQLQQMQKMESIGNLAGGIAHDFNNLLFPIVGLSEMMLDDFPPESLERQNIQEIFNAGTRGRELVQQILSFSRQSENHLIPVHIQKILKEVIKLCRSTIPTDITITRDIQTNCGPVMADPTQIHQIGMNLITNAYHAVESTGGTITIQLKETDFIHEDDPPLNVTSGRYAVLTVSDTGTGIDPVVMNKIFDPYFTTKEKGRGTGLGLATVYGIVKAHGGDIRVHSEMEKGSSFHVYLPMLEKSADVAPENQQQPLPTGTEHILLVDDEKPIVLLEKKMLERLGYKVDPRTSSPDALEAFRKNSDKYDLIISDMSMPQMTGKDLAEELLKIRPDIAIIICTGFSERINKEKAEASGIKGFLMKPVVKSDMAKMVRKVLDEVNDSAHYE